MIRSSTNRHCTSLFFFCIFAVASVLPFFSLFTLRCQSRSLQNRGRSSRSRYWPRGNVNTCLATTDLSGRIKNTISGREPGNACLIESRSNHGSRFSRCAAFRSDGYNAKIGLNFKNYLSFDYKQLIIGKSKINKP